MLLLSPEVANHELTDVQSGWVFDIEILLLAALLKIPIMETPIAWKEVEGSKMRLIQASLEMAVDLLTMRLNYLFGRWRLPETHLKSQ